VTQGRRKRRAVLHARLRVRAVGGRRTRTLHVFDLHLGLAESERRAQLAQFLAAHPFRTLHERTPLVVAGDFNDLYGSLGPRLLAPEGLRATGEPVATFPAWLPLRPLDAVWARGDLRVTAHQRGRVALTRQASDHLPLVVDFALM
jgi:endonuclease/exonuclease/phosphatase family metal-dependent hydrolase